MFGTLDISASALVAQRIRMDTIAGNLANASTTTGVGQAYQRRAVLFAAGAAPGAAPESGVHVAEIVLDPRPGRLAYQPGHNHPFPGGPQKDMVRMPNVDPLEEMVNGMLAVRAYEANIAVMSTTRSMVGAALRLLS
jgi:flagellar basal-body rod protein FlgC